MSTTFFIEHSLESFVHIAAEFVMDALFPRKRTGHKKFLCPVRKLFIRIVQTQIFFRLGDSNLGI